MMFKSKFIIIIMSLVTSSVAEAGYLSERGCATKKTNLERELEYAHIYGNINRIRGIERALSNIDTYCTPSVKGKDYNTLIKKKERDILKLESEISEYKDYYDADKLYKKQRKIKEAQSELSELRKLFEN
ncbi:TPA: DUF1090 domain-containing protein [Klebsiella aerogenes]|nr:DUF1090 domain-containing protein [Klebsiella aerogenes]